MSDEPITLREVGFEPVPQVVGVLEDLLERAKRGEVRGVAFAILLANRYIATEWEPAEMDSADLVYALWVLDQRLRTATGFGENNA